MNVLDINDRHRLLADIKSSNNKARKQWSFRQFEVAGGRIQQFVKESLLGQLDPNTVREMPIVSSINVQKAVTDKKATIYKKKPTREFTLLSDEQHDTMQLIYRDMKADMKLNKSNKNYVYQDQSIGMIVPKHGKLIMRVFNMHQIDAIVDPADPESALGFVISVFDRTEYEQIDSDRKEKDVATGNSGRSVQSTASQDNELSVAEKYQFQKYRERYIVWTPEYNFMMNGLGEVIDPDTLEASTEVEVESPLSSFGIMPFFEIARDKDFEFFVRPANALTDFTIQFNERLSDLAMNQKMNGYAVAILKTPSDLKPQNLTIGHSQIIHLATDGEGGNSDVDFTFASPSSNISEIADANDKFLNYFVTSEGLGGDVVNSSGSTEKATSGIDRFLQAMQKIEAHVDDYEAYRCAESDIYEIIKAWCNILKGSDKLDKKYWMTVPKESEINVEFYKPEMMQTETELVSNIERKLDLGLMSKKEAIKELRSIEDDKKAMEILKEIEELEMPIAPDQGLDFDSGNPDAQDDEEDEAE
jgi:hypothetical protein